MDIDLLSNIFYAMVRCGTPLLLVALGELICEKSGVINLGQEGMMLFGAVIGFIIALSTGNLWLGVLLAMLAGMLLSALFALVALVFNANQVATGLALTIFGVGLSSFVGAAWVGKPLSGFEPVAIPLLSDIPLIGRMLFAQDLLVYLSFALFALVEAKQIQGSGKLPHSSIEVHAGSRWEQNNIAFQPQFLDQFRYKDVVIEPVVVKLFYANAIVEFKNPGQSAWRGISFNNLYSLALLRQHVSSCETCETASHYHHIIVIHLHLPR